MLGRHVKPGNGRKRKRAVWPPLPHLLGDTGNQETGREGGEEGRVVGGTRRVSAEEKVDIIEGDTGFDSGQTCIGEGG